MSESFFFVEHLGEREPLTFLFLEYMQVIAQNDVNGEVSAEAAIREALIRTKANPTDERIEAVAARLHERHRDQAVGEDEQQPQGKAKAAGWGDSLTKWALDRSPLQLCAYVADFNARETRRLYCEEDADLVFELARAKYSRDYAFAHANFEAAILGNGGSFKDSGADVVDLTDGGDSANLGDLMGALNGLN